MEPIIIRLCFYAVLFYNIGNPLDFLCYKKRSAREFVIICENKKYCIPLSSPKEKHKAIRNDIDFMKIYDGDKMVGVLNFNNMIPINERYAKILDLKINKKQKA